MNLARQLCTIRHNNIGQNVYRKFRFSSANYESSQANQPQVQEEKFDFEDLKVHERIDRRKAKIPPFMKEVFLSVFNRELLAYPEILNKEESEALDDGVSALDRVFSDPDKTKEDRIRALKGLKMYSAPVPLTNNGLALNYTESIRYLEVLSSDISLGQEISDHWVGLEALKKGLEPEQFNQIVDDLTNGENSVTLCIKEKVAERISQADFRTYAELDQHGIWRISGEKFCPKADGYRLVLCSVEGDRLKAFLVHPKVSGVSQDGKFVVFKRSPATPLTCMTEQELAHVLGTSRLHAATLCRSSLKRALHTCVEYVRPRAFSGNRKLKMLPVLYATLFTGKPLSELSTIRATIGDALLQIYASESAEYFTAGLMDGYEEPDAELEVAMCRNFIANHGLTAIMKLLSIPALEKEEECKQLLEDMRHLCLRGESLDSVNTFIALNGIHHAGQRMSEEIKQIRNPLMHPSFIIKKVLANRHQEKDDPKLDLYLAEHLHPSLKPPAEQLEYCALRMRFACETLMARHGVGVAMAYTELNRLAEAATNILVMTSVLARASRSYCIGLRNAEVEMKLAACFVENTKDRVRKLILEINDGEYLNLDHFRVQFGKKVLDSNSTVVEKPTARTYW